MARKRLYDATQTHVHLACPACGQKYLMAGIMVQDEEELSCTECNALFRLRISNDRIEPYLVTPSTGAPRGPAEGPVRY